MRTECGRKSERIVRLKDLDVGVVRTVVFQWIFYRVAASGVDLSGFGWGPITDSYEHGSEYLGSVKHGEFFYWLNNH